MDREPRVRDLMRRDVPLLSPGDTISTVASALAESGLPGLPVVEAGQLVGIITESDIIAREADVRVPSFIPFLDAIFVADGGRDFDDEIKHVLAVTANNLMTSPVFSIRESATLAQVATLMLDQGVNPVPVVDDDLNITGIVSRGDLVRVIARLEKGAQLPVDQQAAT